MTSSLAHQTHPQRGQPNNMNFMAPDSSTDSLNNMTSTNSIHMKSQASIKTFTSLPPGAVVIPANFGVKYKPAKLGLEYYLQGNPDQCCIYEVTLTSYIEQGMNATQIVDLLFDIHGDFINPKVIARRQVTRLVDRLLTRVAPDLILNRRETGVDQQATPAKPSASDNSRHHGGSKVESKNLALQLEGVAANKPGRHGHHEVSNNSPAAPNPAAAVPDQHHTLLEAGHAPESERSDAFSIPVSSSGQNSARQQFNQVQKGFGEVNDLRISEIGNIDGGGRGMAGGGASSDLEDDMEKLLKSGSGFGGAKDLKNTINQIKNELGEHHQPLDSPDGHNGTGFVQDQINQLTEQQHNQGQVEQFANDDDEEGSEQVDGEGLQESQNQSQSQLGQSQIDIDNLTESQLIALQEQQQNDESGMQENDEDVIDVDNPEDLAKKGLRRVQIEGDEQEYLLDNEGNIYNLQGEFVGTTGDDDDGGEGQDDGEEDGQADGEDDME